MKQSAPMRYLRLERLDLSQILAPLFILTTWLQRALPSSTCLFPRIMLARSCQYHIEIPGALSITMGLSSTWGSRGSALAFQMANRCKNLVTPPTLHPPISPICFLLHHNCSKHMSSHSVMDSDGLGQPVYSSHAILMNVTMSGFNLSQEAIGAPCLHNCEVAFSSTNLTMSGSTASQGAMSFGLDNSAEHSLTQLYPIAKAADLQQYIITVKANGVRKYCCNYFQQGSPQCHFIGTRKQVQSHIRRAHLQELKPFKCTCGKYFVGRPEGIRHVTTKTQGKIYECGGCHHLYARKDYRDKHERSCLTKSK
ncbi:hypothetical protein JB92DRAFT_2874295 [Gautieria morchelliformis]|nr:hypothetical protein JB92DRAFT_2874295 [Gautieria morchelliformis]